jgi:hypothetical protein
MIPDRAILRSRTVRNPGEVGPCASEYSSTGERFSVKLSLLRESINARSHRRRMVHMGASEPSDSLAAFQERSPTDPAVRKAEMALLDRRRWAMRALRPRCGFYPSRTERKETAGLADNGAVATTRRSGRPYRLSVGAVSRLLHVAKWLQLAPECIPDLAGLLSG